MRALLLLVALHAAPALACEGLHLNLGAGYDTGGTFNKTMSDFRLEYSKDWWYVSYGHHSTYQTGFPFNSQKDKNTSDYVSAGIRIRLW